MPVCEKTHLQKIEGKMKVIPHYYIAGICIWTVSESTFRFLQVTFPFHHGKTCKESRFWRKNQFSLLNIR